MKVEKIQEGPFINYRAYKIWHEKEGRHYVCLVPPAGSNLKRTTITLAKFELSKKLGRWLSRKDQVDHKDGDKTNDDVDNLQVLSQRQNAIKQIKETGKALPRHLKQEITKLRDENLSFRKIGEKLNLSRWQTSRIYRGL